MSVIIKNFSMPINCQGCPCWWEDIECNYTFYCQAGSMYTELPLDEHRPDRPEDCPLREIGEGKRIIVDDCERFIAKCSKCGLVVDSRKVSNYCPNCGAEMKNRLMI